VRSCNNWLSVKHLFSFSWFKLSPFSWPKKTISLLFLVHHIWQRGKISSSSDRLSNGLILSAHNACETRGIPLQTTRCHPRRTDWRQRNLIVNWTSTTPSSFFFYQRGAGAHNQGVTSSMLLKLKRNPGSDQESTVAIWKNWKSKRPKCRHHSSVKMVPWAEMSVLLIQNWPLFLVSYMHLTRQINVSNMDCNCKLI